MAQYIVKALKTYLKSPLTTSALSVVLRKLVDSKNNNLAMADFGSFGVIVIKQGDTIEMIKFTGLTQNATNCTLTIPSTGRNLNPTQPYAGSAIGNAFQSGAEVIVTNDPLTVMQFGNLNNAQTWALLNTFTVMPQSTAIPSVGADLINKTYADALVLGVLTTINVIVPATAGETVVAGNLIYFDTTDDEWKKCDADTAGTVENTLLGIAQGAGVNGGAILGGVLLRGLDTNQTGMTQGDVMYASNTAGGISSSAGTKEVTIGIAKSATNLYFNPRFNQTLTENQQDLIEAVEAGTDFYAASAVGTDAYAITISPAITAYVSGMRFRFKADVANTGACTLAVSGLSALAIKKANDQDTATGDIEAGQIVEVVYDGTDFQMQSQVAQSLANDVFITMTAGEAMDGTTSPLPVCIDNGASALTANIIGGVNNTGSSTFDDTTKAFGQSFTMPSGYNRLKTITIKLNKISSPTSTMVVNLYLADVNDKPTGASLGTSGTIAMSAVGSNTTHDFVFSTELTVVAGVKYCAILTASGGTLDGTNYVQVMNLGSSYAGFGLSSTDSGGTWSTSATDNSFLMVGGFIGSGAGRIVTTDSDNVDRQNNFIGFLKSSVADASTTSIQKDGIVSGFTGLSAGSKYYVSDTFGTIGTTAGTRKIKVGWAKSTTELVLQVQEVDATL